jgi:HSP20 family protein
MTGSTSTSTSPACARTRSSSPSSATEDGVELIAAERPQGTFTRQLFLGETLDTDKLEADYDAGVLTVRIPVAEQAKPRRVEISASDERRRISA